MRLEVETLQDLDAAIGAGKYADYVYMYPPRQAYRPFRHSGAETVRAVCSSLSNDSSPMNVYIHVPFCAQICRFCNLYTTPDRSDELKNLYVDKLVEEMDLYTTQQVVASGKQIRTLYFGGGTPNTLTLNQIDRLVTEVNNHFDLSAVEELAIELAPELITAQYLAGIQSIGFSRISMGLQSTDSERLTQMGRGGDQTSQIQAVDLAMSAGFNNVCVDLIFGLPGEDLATWEKSVLNAISTGAETICAYSWTKRPRTGFGKLERARLDGLILHKMWALADGLLRAAGYSRETHVRWIKPGGGYLQKKYHWGMDTLLGFGAGARSYLRDIDIRNGYSLAKRSSALDVYMKSEDLMWKSENIGFRLDSKERQRKSIVLGLHEFNISEFETRFGSSPLKVFSAEFNGLLDREIISVSGGVARINDKYMSSRDLIVQIFFSEEVRKSSTDWKYDE